MRIDSTFENMSIIDREIVYSQVFYKYWISIHEHFPIMSGTYSLFGSFLGLQTVIYFNNFHIMLLPPSSSGGCWPEVGPEGDRKRCGGRCGPRRRFGGASTLRPNMLWDENIFPTTLFKTIRSTTVLYYTVIIFICLREVSWQEKIGEKRRFHWDLKFWEDETILVDNMVINIRRFDDVPPRL